MSEAKETTSVERKVEEIEPLPTISRFEPDSIQNTPGASPGENKEVEDEQREQYLSQTKAAVNLAYDVRKNHFLQVLEKFNQKYLRLKIVQNQKRSMPSASDFLDRNAAGLGFDADQMSMSGASSFSESQLSSTSGQSSSGISQTSKLSKRNPDRK